VPLISRLIASNIYRLRIDKFCLLKRHIRRQVYYNRSGSSTSCYMERLFYYRGKVIDILYKIVVFCNRARNTGHIRFLKRIVTYQMGLDLSCNSYHRYRIHKCGGNTCYQVCCPGPGCGNTDAHLAGGSGITVRSMGSTLLMPGEYESYR